MTATVANQQSIDILGHVKLPVIINGEKFWVDFKVVQSLLYDVILGLDFCKRHNVVLDFAKGQLSINKKPVKSRAIEQAFGTCERLLIPAYSEKLVTVKPTHLLEREVFVRVSDALRERTGVHVGSGIIHPNPSNLYQLLVCNLTSELVELPARTILAQAEKSEDYDLDKENNETLLLIPAL